MQVWIAEKALQAADIARVLGVVSRGDGYFDTHQGRVVYASGHLLEQAPPEAYNPEWEAWTLEHLPLAPPVFKMRPRDARSSKSLAVIRDALSKATRVIVATDPDREGEAIAREIMEEFRYRGPVQRLWLKGLDDRSIAAALSNLKSGSETLPLYWSSQARSRADWMWGLSLTRLASLLAQARGHRGTRNVGRVQTPTLALVVRRDLEIEGFVSRSYFELAARVQAGAHWLILRYAPPASPEDRRLYERDQAEALRLRAEGASAPLQVNVERKRQPPPQLFSLRGLQKACSAKFGWPADKTLSVAQALYETHKAISYPRSNCPFLPVEQAQEIPQVLAAIAAAPPLSALAKGLCAPLVRTTVWNTERVTSHHAIIPTMKPVDLGAFSADESKAYLLIARRYLAGLMPDAEFDETRIRMDCNGVPFSAVGRTPRVDGWKAAFGVEETEGDDDTPEKAPALPGVENGTPAVASTVDLEMKDTQPPARYTEGTLIEDMASIAKFATDPRIKQILKGTEGLGTEATRAGIIKQLRQREFLEAQGRSIRSTALGRELIASLPAVATDPALTAVWEERLELLASGKLPESAREEFLAQVVLQLGKVIATMKSKAALEPAIDPKDRPDGPPTAKMLKAADFAAKQRGHKRLPDDIRASFKACRAYLDVSLEDVRIRAETGRPSDRAIEFAQRLAAQHMRIVPASAFLDRSALSLFIDELKGI